MEKQIQWDQNQWRALFVFNIYRAGLSLLLIGSSFLSNKSFYISQNSLILFLSVAMFYFSFSLASFLSIYFQKPKFDTQVVFQVLIDIIILTTLLRLTEQMSTSIVVLINLAIAGGSLLMPGRMSLVFASIATVSVLSAAAIEKIAGFSLPYNVFAAGILCLTFFATAISTYILSRRLRGAEDLATARGVDIATLEKLNSHVIQRLGSGIIVVRHDGRIRLMNHSARYLLGLPDMFPVDMDLVEASPMLALSLREWRQSPHLNPAPYKDPISKIELTVNFTALEEEAYQTILIFLEDCALAAKQAQEIKLHSLGRLSASIAHEIRNPLGAISHAAQLLEEIEGLPTQPRRFIEIIRNNTDRVNNIINNVLQISRRKHAEREKLQLKPWLNNFIEIYRLDAKQEIFITLDMLEEDFSIQVDSSQLQQILTNLCDNGIRYSMQKTACAKIKIRIKKDLNTNMIFLDVIDYGDGISNDVAHHIFEPFFTTTNTGTGLGLYVVKELCEANGARLSFFNLTPDAGCCFRLSFYQQV